MDFHTLRPLIFGSMKNLLYLCIEKDKIFGYIQNNCDICME